MSLTTRCPACSTGFRVTPQQLQAHQGTVRCGRCSNVFNALDNLATLPDTPGTPDAVQPAATPFPEEPAVFKTTVVDLDVTAPPPAETSPGTAGEAVAHNEGLVAGPDLIEEDIAPTGIRQFWQRNKAWTIGGALLSVVLAGQVVYVLRTEIAAMNPGLRSVLEKACGFFGCSIPLPRRPEHWSIDSSDLQAEPERANVMTLSAVLRNRAPFAQAYPALELTLEDTAGRPVGRRVLAAGDYLPKDADPRPGVPANGEIVVRLTVDTGELGAAGYRLFLFYPPVAGEAPKPAPG